MSRTTVYEFQLDGSLAMVGELNNAWGFCPVVWGELCKRYLGGKSWMREVSEELWALAKDPRLKVEERCALLLTFDRAVVEPAYYEDAGFHLRAFQRSFSTSNSVNHLYLIAKGLVDRHINKDPGLGICYWGNSVSENLWFKYDEETDISTPYDLKTGTEHFFVGEEMNKWP